MIPRPWKRAAIWQHSNGKFGPIKNVPGFGPVDVNAMHPDLPLSALRVRKPHAAGNDLDLVRRDLQVGHATSGRRARPTSGKEIIMTGLSVVTGVLQKLPAPARRTLYSVLMAAGALLAAAQVLGWPDFMPFSLNSALQAYAYFSPAAGVVAVANVSATSEGSDDFGQDFTDDGVDDELLRPDRPDELTFA